MGFIFCVNVSSMANPSLVSTFHPIHQFHFHNFVLHCVNLHSILMTSINSGIANHVEGKLADPSPLLINIQTDTKPFK